jgi:hypothetical protein
MLSIDQWLAAEVSGMGNQGSGCDLLQVEIRILKNNWAVVDAGNSVWQFALDVGSKHLSRYALRLGQVVFKCALLL